MAESGLDLPDPFLNVSLWEVAEEFGQARSSLFGVLLMWMGLGGVERRGCRKNSRNSFWGLKRAEAALQRLFLGVLGLIWGCFGLFREFFNERLTSGTGFGIITNSSDESKDKAVEAKRAL